VTWAGDQVGAQMATTDEYSAVHRHQRMESSEMLVIVALLRLPDGRDLAILSARLVVVEASSIVRRLSRSVPTRGQNVR